MSHEIEGIEQEKTDLEMQRKKLMDMEASFEKLREALRRQQGDLLDIESDPAFDEARMRLPGDGHWNEAGHAFVAARVLEFIESRELLEPESLDHSTQR